MGYYVRALLTEWEPRPLRELLEHSRGRGHQLRPDRPGELGLDADDWTEVDLLGPGSSAPVEVEVALADHDPESLLRAEVEEFEDELDQAAGSDEALARVRNHLGRTKAIVSVRLPASDTEAAREAAQVVLDYYAQRSGVLFQMDADGFYDGDDRIVDLS